MTRLAAEKSAVVAKTLTEGVVLGADTIVVHQGQVLGKPAHQDEAVAMLSRLQGDSHEVFTGIALINAETGKLVQGHERTTVFFRSLSAEEIRRYVATNEPMDKAGAYGAQGIGASFIEYIKGSYSNVVGLPLSKLALMLKEFGYEIP